jgi:hypothetical protein
MPTRSVMRRSTLLGCLLVLAVVPCAGAVSYAPPAGRVFNGVAGGHSVADYVARTGADPAVVQSFVYYGGSTNWAFDLAEHAGARVMLHIGTTTSSGAETVTPAGIAHGREDRWLVALKRTIAQRGEPVYIRLMAEMDGHWNAYSAYGPHHDAAHSTKAFKAAWRRTTIILRGGPDVDAQLRALHLPPLQAGDDLQPAQVAMQWVPQVEGAPDVPGNSPLAYWPGARYVDWVGTDFYSKFPNFSGLDRFYASVRRFGKPFVFGEWAVWGADNPGFVQRLFSWTRSHGLVRMLVYNQGKRTDGPFRLNRYPRAARALRSLLNLSRFRFTL